MQCRLFRHRLRRTESRQLLYYSIFTIKLQVRQCKTTAAAVPLPEKSPNTKGAGQSPRSFPLICAAKQIPAQPNSHWKMPIYAAIVIRDTAMSFTFPFRIGFAHPVHAMCGLHPYHRIKQAEMQAFRGERRPFDGIRSDVTHCTRTAARSPHGTVNGHADTAPSPPSG